MSGKLGVHAHEVETAMMTRWFRRSSTTMRWISWSPLIWAWMTLWPGGRAVSTLDASRRSDTSVIRKPHDPNLWRLYTIRARLMAETILERVGAA